MPTTNCPHCNRVIPFELDEMHTVFECAGCGGKFTPAAGPLGDEPESSPDDSAFGDLPRDSVGEHGREPWFYGLLETYATVLLYLGLVGCLFGAMVGLIYLMIEMGAGGGYAVLLFFLVVFGAALSLLGTLIAVALIRLSVDTGRNVREVLRRLDRRH